MTETPGRVAAIAAVIDVLRCPVCAGSLEIVGGSLRCSAAHTFDVARQGYVSLLDGRSGTLRADTAEMVAARDRVHRAGVLAKVVETTATLAADALVSANSERRPLIVDSGAGGGHYLRAALTAAADRGVTPRGLGVDLSRQSARALARGPVPLTAVVADIWRGLPVADGSASVVLSVFSPRNVAEFVRVLRPDGVLILVRPLPAHLGEIVGPMRMLSVDDAKSTRVHAALADHVQIIDEHELTHQVTIPASTIADLAGMGPSAFHLRQSDFADLADEFAGDGAVNVTVSVAVTVCRPAVAGPRW